MNILKIQNISIVIILSVFFSACLYNNPSVVAKKFLNAIHASNYDEARKYATNETGKLIDLLESLDQVSNEGMSDLRNSHVEIIEKSVEGDIAWVKFKSEINGEVEALELRRIDGKWLAHVTKENISEKDLLNDDTSPENNDFYENTDTMLVN